MTIPSFGSEHNVYSTMEDSSLAWKFLITVMFKKITKIISQVSPIFTAQVALWYSVFHSLDSR